jgi:hypothetical protein
VGCGEYTGTYGIIITYVAEYHHITMLSYRRLVVNNEKEEFAAGSTLHLDQNAYMMAVAYALLKTGTPFSN